MAISKENIVRTSGTTWRHKTAEEKLREAGIDPKVANMYINLDQAYAKQNRLYNHDECNGCALCEL